MLPFAPFLRDQGIVGRDPVCVTQVDWSTPGLSASAGAPEGTSCLQKVLFPHPMEEGWALQASLDPPCFLGQQIGVWGSPVV